MKKFGKASLKITKPLKNILKSRPIVSRSMKYDRETYEKLLDMIGSNTIENHMVELENFKHKVFDERDALIRNSVIKAVKKGLRVTSDFHEIENAVFLIGFFQLREYLPTLVRISATYPTIKDNAFKSMKAFKNITLNEEEKKEITKLIGKIWYKKDVARETAAFIINFFELTEHLPILAILSMDSIQNVKTLASNAFSNLCDVNFSNWLHNPKNYESVKNLAELYVEKNLKKVLKTYSKKYKNPVYYDPLLDVRLNTIFLIGFFHLDKQKDKLSIFLLNGNPSVVGEVIKSLKNFETINLSDELRESLRLNIKNTWNKSIAEKQHASFLIAYFEFRDLIPELIMLSVDQNEMVSKVAIEALGKFFNDAELSRYLLENKDKLSIYASKFLEFTSDQLFNLAAECSPLLFLFFTQL